MTERSDVRAAPQWSPDVLDLLDALASAQTEGAVLEWLLDAARRSLLAPAAQVWWPDRDGLPLTLAASSGAADFDVGTTLAAAVWHRREALYLDDLSALPDQPETGVAARPGAAAALPLPGAPPAGVLTVIYSEPHPFSWSERRVLSVLLQQAGAALVRLQQAGQELGQHHQPADALRAFVQFTERVASSTDVPVLAEQAIEVLRASLGEVSVGYYEADGDFWTARVLSQDPFMRRSLQTRLHFPRAAPGLQRAFETNAPLSYSHMQPQEGDETGEASYETGAVYPYSSGGEPKSWLGIGRVGAQLWTEAELDIFKAVGRSLGLALERAEQTRQLEERQALLEEERAALDAFVTFTEAVGTETDLLLLAAHARDVLNATVPELHIMYYTLDDQQWQPRVVSGHATVAPLPLETPGFAEALWTRSPVTVSGWNGGESARVVSEPHGNGALYPYFWQGRPFGLLAAGTRHSRHWTPRARATFMAVARSLALALERAATAETLQVQNAELLAQTQALEAFAQLTSDLGVQRDPYALIRRAQEVALSLLPDGFAAYYEPQDQRWTLRSQVGERGHAGLEAAVQGGLEWELTPTLTIPWSSGRPLYQQHYHPDTDGIVETAGVVQAVASLPLLLHGQPTGVFAVAQFGPRLWNASERAMLEGVTTSLGLALERAQGLMQLAQRSAELEHSNAALTAANEELEGFTYSVSHDLRTPVRHVMGFADLALREVRGTPNSKVERYLNVIHDAATRMNTLIDGMLTLSRMGRQDLRLGPVNLDLLVRQAQHDVRAEFPAQPVEWQVAPLPVVWGDSDTLQQVITNLLSNAVKYSQTRPLSVVKVEVQEGADGWTISVGDNGVGFDPAYQHKLFVVFQRLHNYQDFQGTGVGLATVRRIVLRHGGQVFAEGRPGEGATFSFTLPRHG
ncbi:ATP-binding protein [Deinococcus sonorensis]|uniref:histidine kinase n=2 Tax=Deinococcus sonorensis TaxID=309891 RepID=A0AAU7U4U9_9DEIO